MNYRQQIIGPPLVVLAIISIYISLTFIPASMFGAEWTIVRPNMIIYLPWLLAFYIATTTFSRVRGVLPRTIITGTLGSLVAFTILVMNDNGHIIDEFVGAGTVTITDLMLGVMLGSIFLGFLLDMRRRR